MTKHFSSFELDVHFVEPDPAIAEHVAACDRCGAYLAELEALAPSREGLPRLEALAPPHEDGAPAPAAPSARPASGRGPAARPDRGRFGRAAPIAGALALAAAVALYVRWRGGEGAEYLAMKGTPAVQLLVRSGGATRVWDGHSPVRSGDAIAISVACERLEHFVVTTDGPAGLARLSEGPCPKSPSPLPFTLVVDDQPGREHFAVTLARRRLGDEPLREHVRGGTRDRDVWVTAFDLPKESR
jgi:hypothetical protein